MSLSLTGVDLRGKVAQPIIEEIIFDNNTVGKELVNIVDETKSTVIFNENSSVVAMQAFTSGVPVSNGTINSFDTAITPVLVQYHNEFDPSTLRLSSWRDSLKPGYWNYFSPDDEFARLIIGGMYSKKISRDIEAKFWTHVSSATATAIAALTPGTAQNQVSVQEQAMIAASPSIAGLALDGVLARMVYNNSNPTSTPGVGGRIKVVGISGGINSTNIRVEYVNLYTAIPAQVINQDDGELTLYVPMSHKQMIQNFNSIPTNFQKGGFSDDGSSFQGVPIAYVPLPENTMIAARKSQINFVTDLTSDLQYLQLDQWDKRTKMWFIQEVNSMYAHVTNQAFNVLYSG